MQIIGKAKVAAWLFFVQLVMVAFESGTRDHVISDSGGFLASASFFLGVVAFLSLAAILLVRFFGRELGLCGEQGVFPSWAAFFGCVAPVEADLSDKTADSAPPPVKPAMRKHAFICRACGAGNEVPFIGSPCGFCGELPPEPGEGLDHGASEGPL